MSRTKLPKMNYINANLLLIYTIGSLYLFKKVYETSKQVIDEEFHLRQGRHYCYGNFSVWDNKITTFPGLYLTSFVFLFPLQTCSTFALRITSLLASIVNVYLIHNIRAEVLKDTGSQIKSTWQQIQHCVETLGIALLPPMYFFAHLYYTDVLAITMVLAMMLATLQKQHVKAAIFGALSVAMRQTSIVWVGMFFGVSVLDAVALNTKNYLTQKNKRKAMTVKSNYNWRDFAVIVRLNLTNFKLLLCQLKLVVSQFYGFILVLVAFLVFLKWNGSIVVGDKTAHEASVHLPQILYFSLFNVIFGFAVNVQNLKPAVTFSFSRWPMVVLLLVCSAWAVHFNTLVHPYMLADNRHYTFYLWNRFYGKYTMARYAIIPLYCASLLSIRESLKTKTFGFQLMYVICCVVQLALQKLIEIRYFLLPYLILRVSSKQRVNFKLVLVELLIYVTINAATFYVFFTKEIRWEDYKDIQRLIW